MLKSITIENFFSFGDAQTIRLNPDVNILVGINASGKSNFIRAIELLAATVEGNFQRLFLQKWGGYDVVKFQNSKKFECICLEFDFLFSNSLPITYKIEIFPTNRSYFLKEKIFFKNEGKEVLVFSDEKYPDTWSKRTESILTVKMLDPEVDYNLDYLKYGISKITTYKKFDVSFESELRKPQKAYTSLKLLNDGINISDLLSSLSNDALDVFDRIELELKNINPNIRSIEFKHYPPRIAVALREHHLSQTISSDFISDGTLQYLLLLSIFYNPNRGSIVCLDEPDNNLHPDMILNVSKGIKYAGGNSTQMVIATHSPLLLNAFELEHLIIFEKDANNQTRIKYVAESDFPDWEGEFLTGQMWLRGQIGGVRW